ncbi:hypothetical protein [Streptomyces collinus]|uniref:hypothetical protein n=1 Tax=Streptomyces collinus TaxID=42684 RepID=UPI0033DAF0CD
MLAELAKAEAVLERRAIARVELAEALAGPEAEADHPPESTPAVAEALVAGAVVPHWRVGLTMKVLAPTTSGWWACWRRRRAGPGCGPGS